MEEVSFDRILLRIAEVEGGGKIRYGFSTCQLSAATERVDGRYAPLFLQRSSHGRQTVFCPLSITFHRHRVYTVRQRPNNRINRVKGTFRDISVSQYYLAARLPRFIKAVVCLNLP